ncbi:MAG: LPS export ABC transporter periplasmic protein LptC [Treponema sp. CETP13]|nr:MAG: LPS export ABC transporter periplasmic protein LptC [Treponema sp. CETP13]
MQKIRFFVKFETFFILFFLFSCSLDYNDTTNEKSVSPEFVFDNANFVRTKDEKISLEFSADKIEQYCGVDAMFGTNINFTSYDSQGKKSLEGRCNLFAANNETKIYQLFSDIFIHSYEKKATITAENLMWNGKTENLVGTTDDTVTITTDEFTMSGTGFTASEKDASFSLQKNVSGIIYQNETVETTDTEEKPLTGVINNDQ